LTGALISRLKFNQRLSHARLLNQLLIDHLERESVVLPDIIAPVPLHRLRLKERGFNQALEIARPISNYFGVKLKPRLCHRTKLTPAQLGLKREERQKNLRNAFVLTQDVSGSHIALVDDVITTGSTITELAKLLKKAGAKRVDAWSVARTQEGHA
jgi:ComF family protein